MLTTATTTRVSTSPTWDWRADCRSRYGTTTFSQFILNSALFYQNEFHVDGFRYDEISVLLALNGDSGWSFCHDMTGTVRYARPRGIQNAEHWPVDPIIVTPTDAGGAGFDVLQHDGLRLALRGAIGQASAGATASIDLDSVAQNLYPPGFSARMAGGHLR